MEMMGLATIAAIIAATMAIIIIIRVTMGPTLEVVRMDLARLHLRQARLMEANMDIISIIEAEAVVTKTVMMIRLGRSGLRNFFVYK